MLKHIMDQLSSEPDPIDDNPLASISDALPELFSAIPTYDTESDNDVSLATFDGSCFIDAIIKVVANQPREKIFHALENAVHILELGDDPNHLSFLAVFNHLVKVFDFQQIDGKLVYEPRRNISLYNKFLDHFFVMEVPVKHIRIITTDDLRRVEVHDVSLQHDITATFENIQFGHQITYAKLSTEEKDAALRRYRAVFQGYFGRNGVLLRGSNVAIPNFHMRMATRFHVALSDIGIKIPKHVILQSLAAIYMDQYKQIAATENFQQSEAARMVNAQKGMFREGLYLQADFFRKLNDVRPEINIFEKTKDGSKLSKTDTRTVNMINGILKKAAALIIKFNVEAPVPVFQYDAGKYYYRYTKHTYAGLISQKVRSNGVRAIFDSDDLERYEDWFADNPMLNDCNSNDAFIAEFSTSVLCGFRKTIETAEYNNIPFSRFDEATLAISEISLFMNRRSILQRDEKTINVYERLHTAEGGSLPNVLISAVFKKRTGMNGKLSEDTIDLFLKGVEQEYKRIAREYSFRNLRGKKIYDNYNVVSDKSEGLYTQSSILRAYRFCMMDEFFQRTNPQLGESLIHSAKSNKPFQEIFSQKGDTLRRATEVFMEVSFQSYLRSLSFVDVIQINRNVISSNVLPDYIKQDYSTARNRDHGYPTLEDLLRDYHHNTILNKLFVDQLFHGDFALNNPHYDESYRITFPKYARLEDSIDAWITAWNRKGKLYYNDDESGREKASKELNLAINSLGEKRFKDWFATFTKSDDA